jgi:WD40 repeat protein
VRLWDPATGKCRAALEGHSEVYLYVLTWSPDGTLLALGGVRGPVEVWDCATVKKRAVFEGHTDSVWTVAWSPDGALLASGSQDKTVRLWDAASGKPVAALEGDASYYNHPLARGGNALAWSSDGATLASAITDGILRLWRRATGQPGAVLKGHVGRVYALAWSPDGTLLTSGGRDATVRVWDVASGELLITARCLSPVGALQFSADGHILRAADDGSATGNRPIPYLFELCNIEIGSLAVRPVSRRRAPGAERDGEA